MKVKQLIFGGLTIFFLGTIIVTMFFSCKREYAPINPNAAQAVEFIPTSNSWLNNYYVTSTNAPYLIPVGITYASNQDRVINFTVTSSTGAVAGQQYENPAPVTIKAGQVLDTLRFQGLYSGYSTGRIDTVVVKFSGYSAVDNLDSMVLVLRPYCDVIGTDLTGNFAHTTDFQSGYGTSASNYTASVASWTPISETSATVVFQGIGLSPDIGFGGGQIDTDPVVTGITATVDWSDPSNFKITIPAQTYETGTFGYGVSTIRGAGTFSSCDQIFTLTYTVTVGSGSFGTFVTTLRR